MTQVVLATHNAHKVDELRRILGPQLDGIELVAYDGPEPVEDGATFADNALIKARAAALHTGLPAIADDSGIAVAALAGAPGIHSARYAGTRVDADNRDRLLAELVGTADRSASFECAAALVVPSPVGAVAPDGEADVAEHSKDAEHADPIEHREPVEHREPFEHVELGSWPGTVLHEAVGAGGFGYDPVFKPAGYAVSAAELRADEKNAISHRAIAFGRLIAVVRRQVLGS